jgi:hypothetical protein
MKVGQKVNVDISYNILIPGIITRMDSGHPIYNKDYCRVTGFGDPIQKTSIHTLKTKTQ